MRSVQTLVLAGAAALLALPTPAAPSVKDVTLTPSADGSSVTVGYTLSGGPAVVTFDIETNESGEWKSIGGSNLWSVAEGSDVWKKVSDGDRTIVWQAGQDWPGHKVAAGGVRAAVKAWSLDDTPDYMVVDVGPKAAPGTQRYYPAVEFLPGGLLGNPDYRLNRIVMRKIMAKGVTWKMGSSGEAGRKSDTETQHEATLTNNYYIGVFEVTQLQWRLVESSLGGNYAGDGFSRPCYFHKGSESDMRPVESVGQAYIRAYTGGKGNWWPNDPGASDTFLGRLRTITGIDFDLPSDAQWEFACRAGNGDNLWGDGSAYTDQTKDDNLPGRYAGNNDADKVSDYNYVFGHDWQGKDIVKCAAPLDMGTAVVGSSAPNAWGLYDMHGNVKEWCLDWFTYDVSELHGAINIDPTDPEKNWWGNPGYSGPYIRFRVVRGGAWNSAAKDCRSAVREFKDLDSKTNDIGFRLACRAGLK